MPAGSVCLLDKGGGCSGVYSGIYRPVPCPTPAPAIPFPPRKIPSGVWQVRQAIRSGQAAEAPFFQIIPAYSGSSAILLKTGDAPEEFRADGKEEYCASKDAIFCTDFLEGYPEVLRVQDFWHYFLMRGWNSIRKSFPSGSANFIPGTVFPSSSVKKRQNCGIGIFSLSRWERFWREIAGGI